MKAVEFESRLERGRIAVPTSVQLAEGQLVRVLILLNESVETEEGTDATAKSVLKRTSGAWQGIPLEREPQGEYEQRFDLS